MECLLNIFSGTKCLQWPIILMSIAFFSENVSFILHVLHLFVCFGNSRGGICPSVSASTAPAPVAFGESLGHSCCVNCRCPGRRIPGIQHVATQQCWAPAISCCFCGNTLSSSSTGSEISGANGETRKPFQ